MTPQLTFVGKDSCTKVEPTAPADFGFTQAPGPGDCTTPNNFIPLADANAFCASVRVTLGGTDSVLSAPPTKKEVTALPDKVRLTAVVTAESVIWDLQVEVCNSMSCVAAAVLDVPRLEGLLLLEEEHRVGEVPCELNPTCCSITHTVPTLPLSLVAGALRA